MSNPSTAGHAAFTLWAQGQQIALSEGVSLERAQFPMLVPASPGGPVALVNVNPHDPTQLGLRNLTTSAWTATLPDGSSKEIGTDKSVRLSAGTVIQAGPLQWEIREQPAPAVTPSAAPAPAHFAPSPQAAAGFVVASEPALQPQPVSPLPVGAGFVQASAPVAPQQAPMGFVQAAPPAPVGFVQDNAPPAGMGFVQDNAPAMPGQPPPRPGGAARNIVASSSLRFSQILPVMGERKQLLTKGLIPGAITAIVAAFLFIFQAKGDFIHYIYVVAAYLGVVILFAIYQLCGKKKPLWVVVIPIVFTYVYIDSGVFQKLFTLFGHLGEPDEKHDSALILFYHYVFSVGLREEFTKALPVLLLFLIGRKLASPLREKIGIWEPLDGVLLGAAAGLGFTMWETLKDYVPNAFSDAYDHSHGDVGVAGLAAVMLVIPRVLNMISGHIAWAGYFGYFIGLAALKPKHTIKLLLIGWLTAATMHAVWDTTPTLIARWAISHNVTDTVFSNTFTAITSVEGILFFAFLLAAILKARQLSPDRAHNFATQIKGV